MASEPAPIFRSQCCLYMEGPMRWRERRQTTVPEVVVGGGREKDMEEMQMAAELGSGPEYLTSLVTNVN